LFSTSRDLAFVVFATFFLSLSCLAANPTTVSDVPHFSIEAQALHAAASASSVPEGTDISVLDEEERYVFDAEGRSVHTAYIVFKVLTQRGAESWDSVSLEWEPWHEEKPGIRARVITSDYMVHMLDAKTTTDAPAKESENSIFSDRRVLRAPLPAVAPGSVVEEEFTSKETAPFFGAGTVSRYLVGRVSVPVQHTRIVLEAPASVPLRYLVELLPDLQPQRTETDGKVKVVFERGAMTGLENAEDNLPSDVPAFPTVSFSTGASWQAVAEAYARIVDSQANSVEVMALAEKLTSGKKSREDRAEAILEYLHKEVRYTGVEFGEAAILPHAPNETLARKYGDCKDKSLLLVTLLRAAGIHAHIALLNAGSRRDVPGDLPGMGLFDHAIVYMPGEPDMWVDATDEHARLGQLPMADQGRFALIARNGTTGLVRTPVSASSDNVLHEIREITLAENGPARVVETSRPLGTFEALYRNIYGDKQNKNTRENLTSYVKSQYLAEKLDRLDRSDPSDFATPFELVLEVAKAKRGFTDLDGAVAAIRLEGLFYSLPKELQRREAKDEIDDETGKPKKKRVEDFQLPEPFVAEWQYKIFAPVGFQPKTLPKDTKLALGPAILTEQFQAESDGLVRATIRFDTVKRRYTVVEATELRNKVAELCEGPAIIVRFEPVGQALLRQGKVRESFQTYRSQIAQHPKEAVHHLQIAKALVQAGMGEAAREEARKAVKLEPNSALAEKTLGDILQYDVVGRHLRPGSDYAGAAAALRAAAKLDPSDDETLANLALLLEYNDEGRRYGSVARLKEAIVEYRKLSAEKLANLGLSNNLAFALFYAGDFADARKEAEKLNPSPKALIVACEAELNGGQAGIAEGAKRSDGEAQFKDTVKTAGEMLMNVRKYSLAAELLQAGASGDDASRTVGLASMLRKARPREDVHFNDDPSGLALQFVLLTTTPDLTLKTLETLMSKNALIATHNMDEDDLKKVLNSGKLAHRLLARLGASPDVTLDILVSSLEPKGEGNDAVGYRETLHVIGGKKITLYMVKENGKYRVLDSSENPNAIGLEIQDRIASHDLTAARTLLDWIREEEHLGGGDDPLSGHAFPRFWTKGQQGDERQMRIAAASILVETKPTAAQGIRILEEVKRSADGEPEKTNIDYALLAGYATVKDYSKLLAISSDLAQRNPESRHVFLTQEQALHALGNLAEADRLADARLEKFPDDPDALRSMIRSAFLREDYKAIWSMNQKVIDSGKAEASDWNQKAWYTLFGTTSDGFDVDSAVRASQLSQNSPNILHTLGCLYAETGKTKEAREVLIQSMDLLALDEPNPDYWYAFGRIAEQYGEREVALADYAKVTKPKESVNEPGSSYQLAQRRIKELQKVSGAAGNF